VNPKSIFTETLLKNSNIPIFTLNCLVGIRLAFWNILIIVIIFLENPVGKVLC